MTGGLAQVGAQSWTVALQQAKMLQSVACENALGCLAEGMLRIEVQVQR